MSEQQQAPTEIEVPLDVAFNIRLQEFDKNITAHKAEAAKLEAEKAAFIYNNNIEFVTKQHQAKTQVPPAPIVPEPQAEIQAGV